MRTITRLKSIFLLLAVFFIALYGSSVHATNVGEMINFNIDKNFDTSARSQVQATLVKTTSSIYFYVEKFWWDLQLQAKKDEILTDLDSASLEFDKKIYPTLTSIFGSEEKPGVDGDSKITILFHSIKNNTGGYFRSADEYVKLQVPDSNEREMLYISISYINDSRLKALIAHEFVHLITFNQKNQIQGAQEEVWLNEARADYASTILGYDDSYEASNLQRRVRDFLEKPSDSLPEWQESKYDYATVNVFMHYLVDQYSISVLADSLKLKLVGIASINEILLRNGAKEDFSQIFTDWTIATLVNDCFLNARYCYLNQNLKNVRISPTLNFLPFAGNSSLSVTNITKNWVGNWQKIIGGNGDLKLEFSSLAGLNFKVPYVLFDKDNNYSVSFLNLDKGQKGEINIKDFGDRYNALVIIPSLQTKISDFNGLELTYPYTFVVSITGAVPQEDQALIQKLLEQIDSLKKQIAAIQSATSTQSSNGNLCSQLHSTLYFGVVNKREVNCLQQFLKLQGPQIYPEGLVTGNFGALTKLAVIRFQEKYKNEILLSVGLSKGTGVVGIFTRLKINQLLKN